MILGLWLAAVAAVEPGLSVSLSPFPGGRTAAYSLSCDEGLRDHVAIVAPALAERDLRASFFLIAGAVPERIEAARAKAADAPGGAPWSAWRELALAGHELGNLSWSHPYLTRVERDRWHREVVLARDLIARQTGQAPISFALPFDASNEPLRAFIAESHPVLRPEVALLAADPTGMVETLLRDGGWRIGVVRGIGDDAGMLSQSALQAHLDALVRNRAEIWVAPVGTVATHIRQRDQLRLRADPLGGGRWQAQVQAPAGVDGLASVDVVGTVSTPGFMGLEARRGEDTLPVQVDVRERRFRLALVPGSEPVHLTVLTR